MKQAPFLFSLIIILSLASCGNTPPLPPVEMTWLSLQAARTTQEGMVEPAKYNANRVYAAKVRIGNEFYSITTHAPLILATTGYGDEKSVSAMRFSLNQDELLLFTRNPKNGEGYRAIIPLEEANFWPQFSFPFLKGNMIEELPVQVVNVIRKPDPADNVRGLREYLQRSMPPEEPFYTELPDSGPRALSDDK
ncbi:MAG: hypothetical protein EYC62_09435 [Alphaproteobacteria bacterium]|nr:MAG: hypothetical protein EYC62_09435 [Alphaproteobacteria bacterium]